MLGNLARKTTTHPRDIENATVGASAAGLGGARARAEPAAAADGLVMLH